MNSAKKRSHICKMVYNIITCEGGQGWVEFLRIEKRTDRPQLMDHSGLLFRSVGFIPSDGRCINFFKARKYCLLTLQSPRDFFRALT